MTRRFSRRVVLGSGLGLLTAPLLPSTFATAGQLGPLRIGVIDDAPVEGAVPGLRHTLGVRHRADMIGQVGEHGHAPALQLLIRSAAAGAAGDAVSRLLDEGVHAIVAASAAQATQIAAACQVACTPVVLPEAAESLPPYAFATGPSPQRIMARMLRAVSEAGLADAGLLWLDELATPAALQAAQDAAGARGLELVAAEQFSAADTALSSVAATVAGAQPEAVVVNARAGQDARAVRDLRAAGFTGPIYCPPSATHPGFRPVAADAAEGVRAVTPWLPMATQAPDDLPNLATMRRFAEGFQQAHGSPDAHAGFGADAIGLLYLAFLGHRDPKLAREKLEQLCCVGVCGVYNMTPDNHGGLDDSALVVAESIGGVWVPALPAGPAPAEPAPPDVPTP